MIEAPQRRRRVRGGRGGTRSHDGRREERGKTSTNTMVTKDLPGFTGSEIRRYVGPMYVRTFSLLSLKKDTIPQNFFLSSVCITV